jgi:hypothetical protein
MLTRRADRTQMFLCDFFLSLLVSPDEDEEKCEDQMQLSFFLSFFFLATESSGLMSLSY